jgi:hypothetical protein
MDVTALETCPFEAPIIVRSIREAAGHEPARPGEGGIECPLCSKPDSSYLWVDERWRIRLMEPTSLPGSMILETRGHYDSFSDLPSDYLVEVGQQIAQLERAILSIGTVARVHSLRWGDGIAHFHVSLYARPYGQLQLRGTFMEIWEMVLPPVAAETVRETGKLIGRYMAGIGRSS